MTRILRRHLRMAVVVLAGAVALSACTSSNNGSGSTAPSSTAPATSASPSETVDTSPTTSDSVTPSTSAATSSAASTKPKPKPTHAPACAASALRVSVMQGGAEAGQEIAVITFTNASAVTCTLTGYPKVSLLLKGKAIGTPAGASTRAAKLVTLAPKAQAQSLITDFSSCQAPVSDTVRVSAPGASTFVDIPLELRACTLVVDPVSHV